MRRTRYLTVLLLALALPVMACGDDDDGTEPVDLTAQFEGSWETQSFTYTSDADQDLTVDIAPLGLGIQSLNVTESGAFTGVLTLPGPDGNPQSQNIAGELTNVTESTMTIDFVAEVNQAGLADLDVTYSLSGELLTFSSDDVTFDFNQDGEETAASLEVILARN